MNEAASNVAILHPGDTDLREQLRLVQSADRSLTQTQIARETGLSPSAVNQWLKGVYAGDNDSIETKMRTWLDAYHQRRATGSRMPTAPAWVDTTIGQRVIGALAYAHTAGDIAMIYGAAGLGKTKAIEHYAASGLNVWIATMSPSTSGVVPAMQEICAALDISAQGGASVMRRTVARRVRSTGGLLVVDEAQNLSNAALEEIRTIHDATGIGIVFVGNEEMYARLTSGTRAAYLDRLRSRVGKRLPLRKASEADIVSLIAAWGIADSKCRTKLIEIGRTPGALRTLTKVLRLASMHALAAQKAVCCDTIAQAWRELGGVE